MTLEGAIKKAADLAFNEDANQVIGKINGEWEIAHAEDAARQFQMAGQLGTVNSSGDVVWSESED